MALQEPELHHAKLISTRTGIQGGPSAAFITLLIDTTPRTQLVSGLPVGVKMHTTHDPAYVRPTITLQLDENHVAGVASMCCMPASGYYRQVLSDIAARPFNEWQGRIEGRGAYGRVLAQVRTHPLQLQSPHNVARCGSATVHATQRGTNTSQLVHRQKFAALCTILVVRGSPRASSWPKM